jgi:phage-related protein (TIGR01555 family)
MGEVVKMKVFGDKIREVAQRFDGFLNTVTGLGTTRDKAYYNRFQRNRRLSGEELDALYSDDDMAARVCDALPEEELRQGYKLRIEARDENEDVDGTDEAAETAQAVEDAADVLDLQSKIIEARVWGRAFGGGVLLLGADDGARGPQMAEPLNEEAIRTFDHINVMDRRFVHALSFYTDPSAPKYGHPKTYLITPQVADSRSLAEGMAGALEVHESRLVIFGGARTTIRTRQENGGWDQSVLQRMQTVLTQYGVSWDSLSHMLQDASQGVWKMKGYIDALASNDSGVIMSRLDLMDMSRSAVRAVVLDADSEDFERQNYSWSGIKDPFEMLMLRLSSAARTPVTVLMGQSPSGMDATGESDIRQWYDLVSSGRENEVKPALERVLKLVMLAKSGPTNGVEPEAWSVTFPSLWQPTPNEEADIYLKEAQADQIYFDMGAATEDEIALSRFSGEDAKLQINLEERRENLRIASEEDPEPEPEPPVVVMAPPQPPAAPVPEPGEDA